MIAMLKKIKIDITTYILILIALLAGYIKYVEILLIIVFFHELGHLFFFSLFHFEVESVIIYPFGGVSKINKRLHERIYKDFLCAIGGILFQILLYILFLFLFRVNLIVHSTFTQFVVLNKSIILFNLLPILPLDGSRMLFSLFTKWFSFKKSYILMLMVSIISLFFFFLYNFLYCLQDIVIYLFLLWNLWIVILEYPYIMNKFYLERVLYDHYYDSIVSKGEIEKMCLTKFYFFKIEKKYTNEKKYIAEWMNKKR